MRILLLLSSVLFLASPAVRSQDFDGIGFYPRGDKPNFSVSIWGPVLNGNVIIKNAYFSPNLLPATLLLTPAGEKLGLGREKTVSRLGVNMHVNAYTPGFNASVADMIVFYPYNLNAMPNVTLKVAGAILKATCKRDPREHTVNAVKAIVQLPTVGASKLKFDDNLMLQVHTNSGVLLEQVAFKVCSQQAYNAMIADAKKEILQKLESDLH
ncbi:hypothetical protein BH10CYA1_BH10CYA1_05020 [soil metagenome]